jgi:3-phenylpropionate/trans-cinnamate dioxygenase ferredoxin reductase subunit
MDARFDYVVVGGGIAGLTAAETIRTREPRATVALIGAEPRRPYSRVLLPDVVTGEKTEHDLELRSAANLAEKGITCHFGRRVTAVRPEAHEVELDGGETFGYGRLLIATGARARRLDVPGGDLPVVHYLRDLDDALRLKDELAPDDAVLVYGSGFVALELAVAARAAGATVTCVMRGPGFFHRFVGAAGQALIAAELARHHVEVQAGHFITQLEAEGDGAIATLSDDSLLRVRHVLVGLGLEAGTEFLAGSGLARDGALVTDAGLRVAEDVWAAGDAATFPDALSGREHNAATWQNAMLQGRTAALNMTGGAEKFAPVTSHVVSCFDLPINFVGDPDCPGATATDTAGDGSALRLFHHEGRLVGAVAVGKFPDRAKITREMGKI